MMAWYGWVGLVLMCVGTLVVVAVTTSGDGLSRG